MDQQGFRFSRRSSDFDSQIGSLFCGILAGGFEAGGELGQIFPGGLAGNFQKYWRSRYRPLGFRSSLKRRELLQPKSMS
jgi:hypothetical protein